MQHLLNVDTIRIYHIWLSWADPQFGQKMICEGVWLLKDLKTGLFAYLFVLLISSAAYVAWPPSLRMLCSVSLHLVFLFGLFWFVSFFFPDHLSSIRRLTPFPADAAGSQSREICQQKLLPGAREPRKPWEMAALFFHRHSLTWNGCFVIARNEHSYFLLSIVNVSPVG